MIKFTEMPYQRPDIENLKKKLAEATQTVVEAKSYAEVKKAYFEFQDMEQEMDRIEQEVGALGCFLIPGSTKGGGRIIGEAIHFIDNKEKAISHHFSAGLYLLCDVLK